MSTPLPQLPIGQVIGSRYRIQSLVGRGGMGMVYAATHELTGRRVAVKLVVPDSDESPLLKERFLSEARIAAAVVHPNIVDVLDMGVHEGVLFLVMELLEGISLERLLEAQTRLSPEQTFAWLFPIMGALATLHEAGIVHRDVKPSNIFLSSLPRHPVRPKLLDFGLARVVSDLRLTRSGTVIGTPLYMAPEHAAGHVAGPQADVWSMGVVLFECLAGVSPFNYSDRSSLAAQVLAGLVRPLSELRPDLPPVLSMVVGRALQRDLGRRYADVRAFAHALYAAGVSCGIAMPRDPDPIGLPDYASWEAGGSGAATTHEQFGPQGSGGSGPYGAFAYASQSTGAPITTEIVRSKRSWWIGLVLAALAATLGYALWPRTAAVTQPPSIPASVPTSPTPSAPTVESAEKPAAVVAPGSVPAGLEAPASVQGSPRQEPTKLPSEKPARPAMQPSGRREATKESRRGSGVERPKATKSSPTTEEKSRPGGVDEVESEWK